MKQKVELCCYTRIILAVEVTVNGLNYPLHTCIVKLSINERNDWNYSFNNLC